MKKIPLSLSRLSPQFCSRSTLQSLPSHPLSQRHSHAPSLLKRHCPCPEQVFGHPSIVQCLPFQPVTQRQVPFLHCPWSLHLGSHCFILQYSPDQPGSHWHDSDTQWPCCPQSKSHNSEKMAINKFVALNSEIYPWNNRLLTSEVRTCKFACLNRRFRDRNNREDTEGRLYPSGCNRCLSNLSCRCKCLLNSNRERCKLGADNQLDKITNRIIVELLIEFSKIDVSI